MQKGKTWKQEGKGKQKGKSTEQKKNRMGTTRERKMKGIQL